MSKISKEELQKLSDTIQNYPNLAVYRNEANTKKRIIEPLLEILGWDLRGREAFLEYPLSTGTSTAYVDYAFLIEDEPVLFIEAKSFDEALSDKYAKQIITYGRIEDVKWVGLTNGRTLKIFNTSRGKKQEDCLVIEIDLKDLVGHLNDLSLFTRESILSGEIESATKRMIAMKNAIRNIKLKQDKLRDDFKNIILEITGNEIEKYVDMISHQLITQTIKLFENPFEEKKPPISDQIPLIDRQELSIVKTPGEIIICPSKPPGVDFLMKYNAWGYVNIAENRNPDYFALYVSAPKSSILYFGEIESISQPLSSKQELLGIEEEDMEDFQEGKRVIYLKTNSLLKFRDPIPLGQKSLALRNLRYTSLEKLIIADNIDDLF